MPITLRGCNSRDSQISTINGDARCPDNLWFAGPSFVRLSISLQSREGWRQQPASVDYHYTSCDVLKQPPPPRQQLGLRFPLVPFSSRTAPTSLLLHLKSDLFLALTRYYLNIYHKIIVTLQRFPPRGGFRPDDVPRFGRWISR